ncbi:MAG: 3-dehydroquinate synthase [Polyangiaceae bacterium]
MSERSGAGDTGQGACTLLLGGPMGAGKSTIGRLVAARTGCDFVDLDTVVLELAGKSASRIFAEDGEEAFRALEGRALDAVLDHVGGPRVAALGGGSLLDTERRRRALRQARVINLTAAPRVLAERVAGSDRPLLAGRSDVAAELAHIVEARAVVYAESHGAVATDALSPEAAADRVCRMWRDGAVPVLLGRRSHAVRIAADGPRAVAEGVTDLHPSSVLLVTDTHVAALHGAALTAALAAHGVAPACTVVLEPGEAHKTLAAVGDAMAKLVATGADRRALVIGFGGGVVTDIAGFCASMLLRGVPWLAVPTTLLGMVDAAIGGKTGVDVGPAKNAAGAFHQPLGVVIAPELLRTESARGYTSGLAEVVKSAAIVDAPLFGWMEDHASALLAREPSAVARVVEGAVAVKAAIVGRDELESGERMLLNFGHTVGHALESHGGYQRLMHGEAVALGMVAAARIGVALGVTPPAVAERLVGLLTRLGLPVALDAEPVADALPAVRFDKKRSGGAVRVVLLKEIGAAVVQRASLADIEGCLRPMAGPG